MFLHTADHGAPPCLYSSPGWTNQTPTSNYSTLTKHLVAPVQLECVILGHFPTCTFLINDAVLMKWSQLPPAPRSRLQPHNYCFTTAATIESVSRCFHLITLQQRTVTSDLTATYYIDIFNCKSNYKEPPFCSLTTSHSYQWFISPPFLISINLLWRVESHPRSRQHRTSSFSEQLF